jgi:hypothetical protein
MVSHTRAGTVKQNGVVDVFTPSAVDACGYFAGLLLGALGGRSKEEILSAFFCLGSDPDYWQRYVLSPAIAEIANGSFKQKEPPEIIGSGFVVRSLEAALWAFHRSTTLGKWHCAP